MLIELKYKKTTTALRFLLPESWSPAGELSIQKQRRGGYQLSSAGEDDPDKDENRQIGYEYLKLNDR